jgi:hypothetical protein
MLMARTITHRLSIVVFPAASSLDSYDEKPVNVDSSITAYRRAQAYAPLMASHWSIALNGSTTSDPKQV